MPLGRLAAIATLAFLVVVITATSALASTFVRRDPGNALFSGGLITSDGGQFTTAIPALGERKCTTSFAATVGAGGGASVTGILTRLTLDPCEIIFPPSHNFLATIGNCQVRSPLPAVSIVASGSGGTISFANPSVRCQATYLLAPGACYYRFPQMTGVYANATRTLTFSNAIFTHTVPSGATDDLGTPCQGVLSTFSADYPNVHTTGGTTVTMTTS